MRHPVVLHFDRQAIAVRIQKLNKRKAALRREMEEVEKELDEQINKLNQLSLIAVSRLRNL